MGLEGVGRVALPEYLASFFDNILWQVPAGTVPVHTHLRFISLDLSVQVLHSPLELNA